jgi:hypothetical protein
MHTGFLVRKPDGNGPLGRPRRNWEIYIKIYLRDIGWGVWHWIHLVQDMDHWWALVNTMMNFRFHKIWENVSE